MISLSSPVEGIVDDIATCGSAAFAEGKMGPGMVVQPTAERVTAPCDGEITFVFPTSHALGMKLSDGTALLIHCGVDTVAVICPEEEE